MLKGEAGESQDPFVVLQGDVEVLMDPSAGLEGKMEGLKG